MITPIGSQESIIYYYRDIPLNSEQDKDMYYFFSILF